MTDSVEQVASEIKQKIARLADFEGDSLAGEMAALKKALLENPAACSLLLPEEIGACVAALRRKLGIAIASASAPKEKKAAKPKAKPLTAAELKAALEEVGDDDFS